MDAGPTCSGGARISVTSSHWPSGQELRDTGDGYVEIVARHSGKCLDVVSASTDDGAVKEERLTTNYRPRTLAPLHLLREPPED
ncbi:RICIN domain-containing protein [Glycomyces sp. L485]|uniref:RICIN domain-containing protein n=1 Tax=Glycomyces sp. L485 TaxID=2909235 RepID=UPI003219B89A